MEDRNLITDGYHTIPELYEHRRVLFQALCNQDRENSWKSKLHDDGTMFEDYFIVGINTSEGQATYHYELKYWDEFDVPEIPKAPPFDGHTPEDALARIKQHFAPKINPFLPKAIGFCNECGGKAYLSQTVHKDDCILVQG